MATLFPHGLFGAAMDEYIAEPPSTQITRQITREFDPNFLFLGEDQEPLLLCQTLLQTVVDHDIFWQSRPSIRVPTLMPNTLNELPMTARHLQMASFGKKFNWKEDRIEGLFFVTNYDKLKLEGIKSRREIPVDDFIQERGVALSDLFGVIFQRVEPSWISSIHTAEIFNFKKRLASALKIPIGRVFWIQHPNDCTDFIERTMIHTYRRREDRECEENEKIVRGELDRPNEMVDKELNHPLTMCYGDIPEKNGITLSQGV